MGNAVKNILFSLRLSIIKLLRLLGWNDGDAILDRQPVLGDEKLEGVFATDVHSQSLEELQSKIIHSMVDHHIFAPQGSLLFLTASFMRRRRSDIVIT